MKKTLLAILVAISLVSCKDEIIGIDFQGNWSGKLMETISYLEENETKMVDKTLKLDPQENLGIDIQLVGYLEPIYPGTCISKSKFTFFGSRSMTINSKEYSMSVLGNGKLTDEGLDFYISYETYIEGKRYFHTLSGTLTQN
jgi:hypothetical protein